MSIGLEEEKKLKTEKINQKEEKTTSPSSSSPGAITMQSLSPLHTSSSPTPQPEVFDSSSDNAMSERKEVADMRPDKTAKVFLHVKEKRQLDTLTTSISDSIRNANPKNSLKTNSYATGFLVNTNPTLKGKEHSVMQSIEEALEQQWHNVETNIAQVYEESEKQDSLGKSVTVYDNENKESHSNLSNNNNNNPFIIRVKFWQAHNTAWLNVYNEFVKAWIENIKLTQTIYEQLIQHSMPSKN